jgi:hypothetical protein
MPEAASRIFWALVPLGMDPISPRFLRLRSTLGGAYVSPKTFLRSYTDDVFRFLMPRYRFRTIRFLTIGDLFFGALAIHPSPPSETFTSAYWITPQVRRSIP